MSPLALQRLAIVVVASAAFCAVGCALEQPQESDVLPFESYAASSTGVPACDAFCANARLAGFTDCNIISMYKSRIELRKRPMSGAAWVEHGTTRVQRFESRRCVSWNGAYFIIIPDGPTVTKFNYNHTSYPDLDALPESVVDVWETSWTYAPPGSCQIYAPSYMGYCAYQGAAGCECATGYGVNNGLHVCNDDALIQMDGFVNGWCSPTSSTCSDNVLRTTAPY